MTDKQSVVERVARAIDGVQLFSRVNDWTSDRVDGQPLEICRHGADDEDEIVVVRRFSADVGETAALHAVVSEYRAKAALAAILPPELRELSRKGTAGEWRVNGDYVGTGNEEIADVGSWWPLDDEAERDANVALITAAVNFIREIEEGRDGR